MVDWIDRQFPAAIGRHEQTSDADKAYNCIAWAAGDDARVWQHIDGYHWPAKRIPMIEALVQVFESLGYESCGRDDTLEDGYDKVALYERNGMYKHAARQLPDGKWTSKLGREEDISHDTPDCVAGTIYGRVHCIMRRVK